MVGLQAALFLCVVALAFLTVTRLKLYYFCLFSFWSMVCSLLILLPTPSIAFSSGILIFATLVILKGEVDDLYKQS